MPAFTKKQPNKSSPFLARVKKSTKRFFVLHRDRFRFYVDEDRAELLLTFDREQLSIISIHRSNSSNVKRFLQILDKLEKHNDCSIWNDLIESQDAIVTEFFNNSPDLVVNKTY